MRNFIRSSVLLITLFAMEVAKAAPIRIACMGDSITAGARVNADTDSYPVHLQRLLGDDHEVRNFGIGGATLIKQGRPSIWSILDQVKAFLPDMVVISLGTNDTVSGKLKHWEKINAFEDDYRELIRELAALPTQPRLFLCTPTAMVLETAGLSDDRVANLKERKPRLQELCRRVRQLAEEHSESKVSLVDLNAVLSGNPDWLTEGDGVHPNERGYLALAETVARQIRVQLGELPNIVLFLVDDMGWQDTSVPFHRDVTAFNKRYRTPSMERLAAAGMKFTQAYACSVCSPTRISLMTGLNAARHRVTNWTLHKNATNDRKHPTLTFPLWNVNGLSPVEGIERTIHAKALPAFLSEAGYRTIHVGKAHFGAVGTPGEDPCELGFSINIAGHAAGGPGSFLGAQDFSAVWRNGPKVWDVPGLEAYHGKDIFLTEALTREALKAVDQAVADAKPFFLYLSHYAVHVPFAEDDRFYQKYREAGLDHTEAMYAAMVEGMDKSLGDVLDRLESHGIDDETIVLFMSDNGGLSAHGRGGESHTHNKPLSSGKGSAHEGGVRVPMIGLWPGVTKPGSICSQPVIIEDFFPTILEIAGIEHAKQVGGVIDGQSFVSLLRNRTDPLLDDRPLYWHFPNNWGPQGPGIGPSSSVRQGDWKLIYYYQDRQFELYHLANDVGEQTNLADSRPEVRQRLAKQLNDYLRSVDAQFPADKQSGELLTIPVTE